MMRSMYSGVAGLKTHQTKMDVIGNNIANVNTVAFKSQSVTFSELMYQTTQNASGANAQTGTAGINARQIGLGVKTGAINTAINSQGASQTTNNPFDIRITGDSFFIVSNGLDNFFTRDGSFYVDGLGNLAMTSNGYNVMGWQVDPETMDIKQDTVSALRIMSAENMTYDPEATTKARVAGIIDKLDTNLTSTSGKNMNLMFYDKLGYPYTAKINIKTTDTDGMFQVTLDGMVDADNNPIDLSQLGASVFDLQGQASAATLVTALNDATAFTTDSDGRFVLAAKTADAENGIAAGDVVYTANQTTTPDWNKISVALKQAGYEASPEKLQSTKFTYTNNSVSPAQTLSFSLKDVLDNKIMSVSVSDGTDTSVQSIPARTLLTDPTLAGVAALSTEQKATLANNEIPSGITAANLFYNVATGKFEGIGERGADNTTIKLMLGNLVTKNPLTGEDESNFEDIEIDFSPTTMFNNSGTSTIAASSGDANKIGAGRKLGKMSGVSIQDDGRIYASYDNGMSRLLGQIAVAEFANASGLEKKGDNLYKNTQNSGDFDGIGIDIKTGGGYMTTGVLEMSNVDLSAEFTEMITTQRGFQANSRIITVSDTLLEELVNLKR